MSDIVNETMSNEGAVSMETISDTSMSVVNINVDTEVIEKLILTDEIVDIVKLTLQQMFENFLNQNKEELEKYNLNLNPEIQTYMLILCKENSTFFTEIENSFKLIILDNTINTKDIPEFLKIVIKIYEVIKNKKISSNVDPYEVIEIILHILFMLYIQTNKKYDAETANQSVEQIVKIIKVAIELLKLQGIKIPANGCFSCLFKK